MYKIIILFFVLNIVYSQNNSTTKSKNIFYQENENEEIIDIENDDRTEHNENTYNSNNFSQSIFENDKPYFLIQSSINNPEEYSYYDKYYNTIYEYRIEAKEINKVNYDNNDVLYFNSIYNDTLIQLKSKSRTYLVNLNLNYTKEILSKPLEFSNQYLLPVCHYFYKFKNDAGLLSSIKRYANNEMNKYIWINEFIKQDYINEYYNLILNKINSGNINSEYIVYEVKVDNYNFNTNSFLIHLDEILKNAPFFNTNFKYEIQYKSRYKTLEFECNQILAREFSESIGNERKAYVKLILTPISVQKICNSNYNDCFKNDFSISSFLISANSSFNNSIKVEFN